MTQKYIDGPSRFTGMMARNSHKVLMGACLGRLKERESQIANVFEASDFVSRVFNELAEVGRDSQHSIVTYIIIEYVRQFDWAGIVGYLEEELPEKFLYLEGHGDGAS